jgi:signal transduction histidine kinase/CheY-like chemotaxis protein
MPDDARELEQRLRILEEENARLTERQEEIALLGRVTDRVRGTERPQEILAQGLERLALLRNLSFAGLCLLEGERARIVEHCSASTDAGLTAGVLPLTPEVVAALTRGPCLLRGKEVSGAGFDGEAPLPISPRAVLLLPAHSRAWPEGCFVLADDLSEQGLGAAVPFLEAVIDAIVARVDNVTLLRELTDLNAALDEQVRVRTAQLVDQIQARERTEASLRQAQKMETIGRLTGAIAHDFNNLLTSIIGVAGLAAEGVPAGSALAEDLACIGDAGRQAARLTSQLLAFGRSREVKVTPLALDAVVGELGGMLGRLIGEEVTLRLDLDAGGAMVFADRSQLEQVVMNLAVNGRDAMPDGGILSVTTRKVALGAGPPGFAAGPRPVEWVCLAVEDTGSGMTPEVIARAFEPFFTTKAEGKGTGLGLATVQGIVKQHGGEVVVASQPGKGTRFEVYLPRVGAAAGVVAAAGVAASSRPLEGLPARLLVVDDDPAVRRVICRMLASAGYEATEAASGGEAVSLMAAGAYDALVTDVMMPGMRGNDLALAFAQRHPGSPVLFISGFPGAAAASTLAGCPSAFVPKPIVREELLTKVRELMTEARRPPISAPSGPAAPP